MSPSSLPTNMRILRPSRKAPKSGDIFTFQMVDGRFRFGRVINHDATSGHGDRLNLIYIYDASSESPEPPIGQLTPERLPVPPLMTNKLPWSRGYFQMVRHEEIKASDLLERHVFWSRRRNTIEYQDELGHRTMASAGPMGIAGVSSYATIDDEISDALGFVRAHDATRP